MSTSMPLKLSRYCISAMTLAALLIAPCHAQQNVAAPPNAPTASVRIDNFSFTPAEITIEAGTALTWVNGDDIPHTIVATSKAFRSKVMDTDQQFTFTFTKPGIFDYFCSLHPHMTGKVIVK